MCVPRSGSVQTGNNCTCNVWTCSDREFILSIQNFGQSGFELSLPLFLARFLSPPGCGFAVFFFGSPVHTNSLKLHNHWTEWLFPFGSSTKTTAIFIGLHTAIYSLFRMHGCFFSAVYAMKIAKKLHTGFFVLVFPDGRKNNGRKKNSIEGHFKWILHTN